VAFPAAGGPVVVLRDRPDRVVAGAHQDAASAVVGSDHQRHLHVVFRPALCGRGSALVVQPKPLGRVCPTVRRVVLRRARCLHRAAGSTAVGSRPLHVGRRRRWPVQPALHVQKPRTRPTRRAAGRHAQKPARCPSVCGADLHSWLGNAAPAIGGSSGQLRTGQRESGRSDSLASCRGDGDDLGLSVAAGKGEVASVAGDLPVGNGLRAGVLRRALRSRHPLGLGAGIDRGAGNPSRRVVVVPAPRDEVIRRWPAPASGRSWRRPHRRRCGRRGLRRNRCAG
jgi:hypothetical protein